MNAPALHAKVISDKGQAAKWAASDLTTEQLVDELYLTIYNRFPSQREREIGAAVYAKEGTTRRMATEDLMGH